MYSKIHEASTVLASIARELAGTFSSGKDTAAERAYDIAKGWSDRYAGEQAMLPQIDLEGRELTVFVRATVNDDFADGPTHARFKLHEAFLNQLLRLLSVVLENRLAYAEEWSDIDWCDKGAYHVGTVRLRMSEDSFQWHGHPKDALHSVETGWVNVKDLLALAERAKQAGQTTIYFQIDDALKDAIKASAIGGSEYVVRIPLPVHLGIEEQARLASALKRAHDNGMPGRFAIGVVDGRSVVSFFRDRSEDAAQISENLASRRLVASTVNEAVLAQLVIELEELEFAWLDDGSHKDVQAINNILRVGPEGTAIIEDLGDMEDAIQFPVADS